MSLYERSQPMAINEYRDRTARETSMVGVQFMAFTCRICRQRRPLAGRKQIVPGDKRYGYRCAGCVQERTA